MSRVVEQNMNRAWNSGREARCSANTYVVKREGGVVEVRLHGHCIAKRTPDGEEYFSLCGWNTMTTRSRLNSLIPHGQIFQHKGKPLLRVDGYIEELPTHETFQVPKPPATRWIEQPLDALTLALLAKQQRKTVVYSHSGSFHVRCALRRTKDARYDASDFTLEKCDVIHNGTRCYVCYGPLEV